MDSKKPLSAQEVVDLINSGKGELVGLPPGFIGRAWVSAQGEATVELPPTLYCSDGSPLFPDKK